MKRVGKPTRLYHANVVSATNRSLAKSMLHASENRTEQSQLMMNILTEKKTLQYCLAAEIDELHRFLVELLICECKN